MMIVRHPSRTDDAKFHIVEDGITAAKFDTLAELHQWAGETVADSLETAASYRSEAEQAENFAASLAMLIVSMGSSEMVAAYRAKAGLTP